MEGNTILAIIGALVVVLCLIFALMIRMSKNPKLEEGAIDEFLEGLSDAFYSKMLEIINNISFDSYSSLINMESDIISQIYNSLWDYTEKHLKKYANEDIIMAMILKVLDKDTVISFIDKLIEKFDIYSKLDDVWTKNFIEKTSTMEEEDKEVENNFSDPALYNEEFDPSDLEAADTSEPSEEELANLNPQVDEEEELNVAEDISVEVVEDDTYIDAKGRKRSKSTGRYV